MVIDLNWYISQAVTHSTQFFQNFEKSREIEMKVKFREFVQRYQLYHSDQNNNCLFGTQWKLARVL